MVKRLCEMLLAVVVLLVMVSVSTAQQTAPSVVRLGNWIEVGNDVFMHIIGTADMRYRTVHNYDFDNDVRDRAASRNADSTSVHEGDGDLFYAELRFGAEFRYQKSLMLQVLFEQQQVFDGSLIDDRANTSNPGGTDVFGRPASTENPAFHIERFWLDYTFPGTPLRMRVGADLWYTDQAGLVGDDDPRFALFAKFGDLDLQAAAVIQSEAQRLGLQNDNDFIFYTFGAGYNAKPHRFQLDITYFRDRFLGADTQAVGDRNRVGTGFGFTGQKHDSVLIMPSWSGTIGPVRALVQGNILVGTARGGTTAGVPGVIPGRDYDIFAAGVVAYAEADLGQVRPFVGLVFGSADGDPTDEKLHGFTTLPQPEITLIAGTPFFAHLETSNAFALRDYSCPARAQNVRSQAPVGNPTAVGAEVLAGGVGALSAPGVSATATDCAHTTGNPFNDSLGNTSHRGIRTTYSNPGSLVIPAGLRFLPLKGHEITGWYVYRAMVDTALLERAFAPEIQSGRIRGIRKTQYHEVGGFWSWTLNPHFDIRLSGNIAIPGEGYKDLARLATCNGRPCEGDDVALVGEARFRARF